MVMTAKDVEFLKSMTLEQLGMILEDALHELYQREENRKEQCALSIALIVVTPLPRIVRFSISFFGALVAAKTCRISELRSAASRPGSARDHISGMSYQVCICETGQEHRYSGALAVRAGCESVRRASIRACDLFHPAAPLRARLRRLRRCPGWPRNPARNDDDLAALAGASSARHPAHIRRSHVEGSR